MYRQTGRCSTYWRNVNTYQVKRLASGKVRGSLRLLMRSFSVEILGCKVNQYEGEQIAQALRRRGMVQVPDPSAADLRVVHTCSVTTQAASKSRQTVRRQLRTSS